MAETSGEVQKTDLGLPVRVRGENGVIGRPAPANETIVHPEPAEDSAGQTEELPAHLAKAQEMDQVLRDHPYGRVDRITTGDKINQHVQDALKRRDISNAQNEQQGKHHKSSSEQLRQLHGELSRPLRDIPDVEVHIDDLLASSRKRNQE